MTRQIKAILLSLSLALCVILGSSITAEAKTITKDGVYTIPATSIKSITKKGNKITVKLTGTVEQQIIDEESGHITTKKLPNKLTFKTTKKTQYAVKYYLSGNTVQKNFKFIKKMIKKVKKNISTYDLDDDDDFEHPVLGFMIEKHKVTLVHYTEGSLEAIDD